MRIAQLEYLRSGIPVLCSSTGRLLDICNAAGQASILVSKEATAEEIANSLLETALSPETRRKMRPSAWERKEYFSWHRTVRDLERIWLASIGN